MLFNLNKRIKFFSSNMIRFDHSWLTSVNRRILIGPSTVIIVIHKLHITRVRLRYQGFHLTQEYIQGITKLHHSQLCVIVIRTKIQHVKKYDLVYI